MFVHVPTVVNEQIKLNRIETVFEELDYPLGPEDVAAECDDVVVRLAEGTVRVDEVIEQSTADQFTSSADLALEFQSLLPMDAVGEPHQSDGDA
jgi:hypothetical protein